MAGGARRPARSAALALALAGALSLTACAGEDDPAGTAAGGASPATSASPDASASAEQDAAFNDVDIRFTQGMLPHHMQAARNAEIEIEMGSDPEVKAIAMMILQTQEAEIATMPGFLEVFGAPEVDAPADQQAIWDRNTEDLRTAATPEARDVVFLTNMVPHHAAAVPMSKLEVDQGSYPEAKTLAMEIIRTQRMEMNALIRARA